MIRRNLASVIFGFAILALLYFVLPYFMVHPDLVLPLSPLPTPCFNGNECALRSTCLRFGALPYVSGGVLSFLMTVTCYRPYPIFVHSAPISSFSFLELATSLCYFLYCACSHRCILPNSICSHCLHTRFTYQTVAILEAGYIRVLLIFCY